MDGVARTRPRSERKRRRPMTDIVNVIIKLARMQGQAIDRVEAEMLNKSVEKAHDKWQSEKQQDSD